MMLGFCLINSIVASFPQSVFSYFVTLIPKVDSSTHLGEFQSIYLVGSLYKFILKILVGRLYSVMDKIISSNK